MHLVAREFKAAFESLLNGLDDALYLAFAPGVIGLGMQQPYVQNT